MPAKQIDLTLRPIGVIRSICTQGSEGVKNSEATDYRGFARIKTNDLSVPIPCSSVAWFNFFAHRSPRSNEFQSYLRCRCRQSSLRKHSSHPIFPEAGWQ